MTLLESLLENSLQISTSCISLSFVDETGEAIGIDNDYRSTTTMLSATTTSSNIEIPEQQIHVINAQAYIESMSTEQLAELDQLLNDIIIEDTNINTLNTDHVKVYTKQ